MKRIKIFSDEFLDKSGRITFRHRDCFGRFSTLMSNEERIKEEIEYNKLFTKRLKQIENEIHLNFNVKYLLFLLVDDFKNTKIDRKSGENYFDYSCCRRYPYNLIFRSHPLAKLITSRENPDGFVLTDNSRSTFSHFIKRMVNKGFVKVYSVGRKKFIRITKKGFDRIKRFHDYYPGENTNVLFY